MMECSSSDEEDNDEYDNIKIKDVQHSLSTLFHNDNICDTIEGVLYLDPCSEDEVESDSGVFHWQQQEYDIFSPSCYLVNMEPLDSNNVYQIEDMRNY